MIEVEWWEFNSPEEMASQAAGDIGFVVESAVEAHGGARLALPGSAAPPSFYQQLLRQTIEWPKVTVIPTDDRLVRFDDPRSHFGALDALFGPKGAALVTLVDEGALGDYRDAGRLADERLAKLDWPLDLVCLAVGDDGHTASILPGPDFERAIAGPRGRRVVGVHPDPTPADAAVDRVTLTADALSSARAIMVLLTGARQRDIVEQALEEGPLSTRPIGRLLAAIDVPVDVFWSAT